MGVTKAVHSGPGIPVCSAPSVIRDWGGPAENMGPLAWRVLSTDHKGWTTVEALYLTFCCCGSALYCCVQLFASPWAVALQAPLSMGFPRQEYWSGLPFPSPGDIPSPGMESTSPELAGGFFTTEPPGKLMPYLLPSKSSYPRDVLDPRP